MLWIVLWITREKKGITPAFAFPCPPCRFSGQAMPFFGKIGTGDIVSYFHKKIKTLGKCKALENVPFAIFAIQTGYPLDPQSLVSHPVENTNHVPPASYALRAELMPELSTETVELSTCKFGYGRYAGLCSALHQGASCPWSGGCGRIAPNIKSMEKTADFLTKGSVLAMLLKRKKPHGREKHESRNDPGGISVNAFFI